jgi:hypothetical protein
MAMRLRFAAWGITHDDRNHPLSFDVREGVLEDGFHMVLLLRMDGHNHECECSD